MKTYPICHDLYAFLLPLLAGSAHLEVEHGVLQGDVNSQHVWKSGHLLVLNFPVPLHLIPKGGGGITTLMLCGVVFLL